MVDRSSQSSKQPIKRLRFLSFSFTQRTQRKRLRCVRCVWMETGLYSWYEHWPEPILVCKQSACRWLSHKPSSRLLLLSARLAVTFPAAQYQRLLASTKSYCSAQEEHECAQLAHGRYTKVERPGIRSATSWPRVWRLHHYAATPHYTDRQLSDKSRNEIQNQFASATFLSSTRTECRSKHSRRLVYMEQGWKNQWFFN